MPVASNYDYLIHVFIYIYQFKSVDIKWLSAINPVGVCTFLVCFVSISDIELSINTNNFPLIHEKSMFLKSMHLNLCDSAVVDCAIYFLTNCNKRIHNNKWQHAGKCVCILQGGIICELSYLTSLVITNCH